MFAKELYKILSVMLVLGAGLIICAKLGMAIGELAGEVSQPLPIVEIFRAKPAPSTPLTIFIAGDIMLDRGVEKLSQKNKDWRYPFLTIASTSQNFDLAIANLEGPVMSAPPNTGAASMSFAFASSSLLGAQEANFKIFSLANNHTYNMNYSGLDETRLLLGNMGMVGIGHPIGCTTTDVYATRSLAIFAFNDTYENNCPIESASEIILWARQNYATSFLLVMPHWGEEYEPKSSRRQQEYAHAIIDSGADLIVGGHPHVVQEIERYRDKYIIYSLGNFVFDQYFSKNTQEGLALGLEIGGQTTSIALLPIDLTKSQPKLMPPSLAELFLDALSKKSTADIEEDVKSGKLQLIKKLYE